MAKGKKAETPLNAAQLFFLQHHPDLNDESAAAQSGASVEQIQQFRAASPAPNKLNRMLHKPKEGVVAMTGEASTLAEEVARQGAVTQDMINNAASAGNFLLAHRLTEMRDNHVRDEDAAFRARNAGRFHFMERP